MNLCEESEFIKLKTHTNKTEKRQRRVILTTSGVEILLTAVICEPTNESSPNHS